MSFSVLTGLVKRTERLEGALQALAAAPTPLARRQALAEWLQTAEGDGGREMSLMVQAMVCSAGGRLELTPAAIAAASTVGGVMFEQHSDGHVVLTFDGEVPAWIRALAQGPTVGTREASQNAPPINEVAPPAANVTEPDDVARGRICTALRVFLRRYYDGELRARGLTFMVTVAGEMLAMAYGVVLGNSPDADAPRLPDIETFAAQELSPRIAVYQAETERARAAFQQPDADDHAPGSTPERLH